MAVVLAAVGGSVYMTQLEIRSGRRQLSNLESPLNQRVERFQEEFGVQDTLLLVVAADAPERAAGGEPPGLELRARMKSVARAWVADLRTRPELFPELHERVSGADMGPLALLYLPRPAFDLVVDGLQAALPACRDWLEAPSLAGLFGLAAEWLAAVPASEPGSAQRAGQAVGVALAERFLRWLRVQLDGAAGAREGLAATVWPALSFGEVDAQGYLFVAGGRLLIVPAAVRGDASAPNQYTEPIANARRALERALAAANEGQAEPVLAGLAGLPALEHEEMDTSQRDFTRGAVVALALVSVLFMLAFSSVLRPALAAICLALSIAITFLFTWLAIGHLNLIGMVFMVILVALGVDFAIHFATHYERALTETADPRRAVRRTLRRLGGALWISGLTTSAAFLTAGLTESPGLSELGVVAGGGLVICLVVMVSVYPALLYLVDRRWRSRCAATAGDPTRAITTVRPRPGPTAAFALAAFFVAGLAVAGFATGQYRFDTNLLALQATSGEAVRWQRLVLDADDRTQFAIATYPDRASLERVRARFAVEPLVRATESVFPQDETDKRRALAPLCEELSALTIGAPVPRDRVDVLRALFSLRQAVRRLAQASPEAARALAAVSAEIDGAYRALRAMPADVAAARLAAAQSELARAVGDAASGLRALCCPPEFRLELAPRPLRRRFTSSARELALYVYPEENTWHREALERFVTRACAIEPDLFGGVVNFRHNADAMVASFAAASAYALVAVVAIVLAWCRSLRWTALALLPLVTSIGLLLGVMRLSPWLLGQGLTWNFANFFALAILIGVGVDCGIHLTSAWRDDVATFVGARRAVLVSTLTTAIGFGVLATSQHLGVRSLGIILSLGIGLVLVTSVVVLPAVLARFAPAADAPRPG